jgi:hypothetical protein
MTDNYYFHPEPRNKLLDIEEDERGKRKWDKIGSENCKKDRSTNQAYSPITTFR